MSPLLVAVVAIAMILLPSVAIAEDILIDGGRSPDAKYELHLVRVRHYNPANDASEYLFRVQSSHDRSLLTLSGSGFRSYTIAKRLCNALWDQSSRFVVITEQDTQHSTKIFVIALTKVGARRLRIPDYVQNALRQINVAEVDRACFSRPKCWDKDNLVIKFYCDANGYKSYTFAVTLHVRHKKASVPLLELKNVTKLEESEA